MKISMSVTRVMAALGAALFIGAGSVAAAPYSNVNKLPERTTADSVSITFDYLGSNGAAVNRVDLYVSKDGGPFTLHHATTNLNSPIVFDFKPFGDGQFSFYTVAYTTNGEVEVKSRTEATIIRDANAPAMPKTDKIFVNEGVTPDFDTVKGNIDSVERNARVEVYSDSALKNLIASVNATETGEWGPVQIGDNTNSAIWIVAVDANGNRSAAARVENKISYSRSITAFHATAYSGDRISLDYTGPEGTNTFLVEYKHAGGSVWSAHFLTNSTTPELVDLEPGRAYDVRVAPVDANGNVGVYVGTTLRTVGKPVGPGSVAAAKVAQPVPAGVGGSNLNPVATTTTPATTAVAEPSADSKTAATPATTEETKDKTTTGAAEEKKDEAAAADPATSEESKTAEEQAATATEEEKSTATPWVILAILIILAGIATGGYFYWFSGPEEVTTTVKPENTDDKDKRW